MEKKGFSNHALAVLRGIAILCWLCLPTLSRPGAVAAQEGFTGWSTPINLSKSSATLNPAMAVDSQGMIHVFWDDEFAGSIYTSGDGMTWSEPEPVFAPFATFPVKLAADSLGTLHAFWTNELNTLYYSRVDVDRIDVSDWESPLVLAENALTFEVEVDENDQLHLVYVRSLSTEEFPAGIYYRQSTSNGVRWSGAALLYASPYYRTLLPEETHVDLATTTHAGALNVYATWDNPAQARVFLASSADGGVTWNEPLEVDKPDQVSGTLSPSHLKVHASGANVLLVWESGNIETGCTSYYQWSNDGGANWQLRQQLVEGLFGCPKHLQILEKDGQPLLFILAAQPYLQVWDGTRWSDPQPQITLTSFIDADTQKVIELDCHRAEVVNNARLIVLGCDSSASPDVWYLERPIGETAIWFPEAPVWSRFITITSGELIVGDPVMAVDANNLVHVFWTESSSAYGVETAAELYYARWEGESQLSQKLALGTATNSIARDPDAAIDSAGNLLLVWADGRTGNIYFSKAHAGTAVIATDWSEPLPLPLPGPAGSAPDIFVAGSGQIFVAYAIPINLNRGIYLTASSDGGISWTEPVRVFDAEAAGWAMVDEPQGVESAGNELHLIWSRYSPPSGVGPMGIYYARSSDGGLTWSAPEAVAEKAVDWSQIDSGEGGVLHRLWKEESAGSIIVWHDLSLDNGRDWNRSAPVSVFGSLESLAALTSDAAQRLHLLHLVNRGAGNYTMQHWIWGAEGWTTEQSLDFSQTSTARVTELDAAATNLGDLAVVLNSITLNTTTGLLGDSLFFTKRSLELPDSGPIAPTLPAATPTATSTVEATLTATNEPTQTPMSGTRAPTPGFGTVGIEENPSSPSGGASLWWYVGGFAVIALIGFGVWVSRTRKTGISV